ncbi:MAG: C39 family peptidase [Candidatus Thermoplasmatota archaeon]|nr:C39 family peptidase [Candidatus Thermoplasmatota archaeon]
MPCINNLQNFPYVLQRENDWCIFASIENVLGYFGFNLSQEQIYALHISQSNPCGLSFRNISRILEDHYGDRFSFDPQTHSTRNDVINYVENRIYENLPVIVSMQVAGGYAHMLIFLGVNSNNLTMYDTGGGTYDLVTVSKQGILRNLAKGKGTLVIRPI